MKATNISRVIPVGKILHLLILAHESAIINCQLGHNNNFYNNMYTHNSAIKHWSTGMTKKNTLFGPYHIKYPTNQ